MGIFSARPWGRLADQCEVGMVMFGLDGAGKTTFLDMLKLDDAVTSAPTIGFRVETIEHSDLSLVVWDVGGRDKVRKLWCHYYRRASGIILVVDSTDRDRIGDVRNEFFQMLAEREMRNAAVLVVANKQDLPGAMSPFEVAEKLGLSDLQGRRWFIHGACARTGQGLRDGLDWLSETLVSRRH